MARDAFGNALNPLEFIRYTARTNCGECGQPSCLAFSVAVTKGGVQSSRCPYLDPAFPGLEGTQPGDEGLARLDRAQEERDMALAEHLKTKIRDLHFSDIAARLGAEWSTDRPDFLRFRYLDRMVELTKDSLHMEGNALVDPRDQILLYNYVSLGGGKIPSGEWIGMESLPNSISKVRTLSAYCEQPLAKRFSGRPDQLVKVCRLSGGQPGIEDSNASLAYIIPVLPHLPQYLLFWDEELDDGFDSRVKVLFDQYVLDYLDIESLVFAAERMAEHLMELDT